MKPFLVDVPVKINIWIREDCQRKQFEVIKKARPSILFVTSDGGRNEKEWEIIRRNRRMYDEEIDWDCKVYKLYMETNLGLYAMGRKRLELIWSEVDRCIFLEDDMLPSVSFFSYCAELLEKYKDDERIECICGMNHFGVSEDVTADYFFSRQGSIWGTATWKRVHMGRGDFSYGKDPYIMKLLKQRTKRNPIAYKRLSAYAKQDYFEGHTAGGEFWIEFDMYAQNRLQIIPKYNMINNIGFGDDSQHSTTLERMPKSIRNLYNMQTYELDRPLNHPKYVIPDIEYEKKKNKILYYNNPVGMYFQQVLIAVRAVFRGDFSFITRKIKKIPQKMKVKKDKQIEK